MKKQFLSKLALATLAVTFCSYSANAQLGNLKNKVKNATNNAVYGNNNSNASSSGNSSSSSTSSSNTSSSTSTNSATADVKVDESLSGEALVEKADAFYNEGKAKEALAHYEAAQRKGDYYVSDGMVRMRMNECRDALDPVKQKQNEEAMAKANQAMDQMEAMKYKCDNIEPDNGVSGATHTKYMKKIVFSKSEIVKGQENEAGFTSSFSLSDNIYTRVYMEKSIKNEAGSVGECYSTTSFLRYTFDDGATKLPEYIDPRHYGAIGEGVMKWTTFQPGVSPSSNDMNFDAGGIKLFVKMMRYLPVGTHKVKVEMVYDIPNDEEPAPPARYKENCRLFTTKFGPEKVTASGEFTLSLTEAEKKALYKKVCPLYKKEVEDYNRPAFTLVTNATELVKKTKNIDWNKFTLLKIVGDSDWSYKKNVYGVVLSRSCGAGAYLLNKEDNFIYYSNVSFYQENISSGGSGYGATSASVEEQNIEYVRNYDSFCKECIGK